MLKELQVDPTVRFYTVEEVKAMDINSLVAKVEEKLGRKLDPGTLTWLAVAKGAGSVHTIDLSTKAGLDDDCAYANFEIQLENGYSFVA